MDRIPLYARFIPFVIPSYEHSSQLDYANRNEINQDIHVHLAYTLFLFDFDINLLFI